MDPDMRRMALFAGGIGTVLVVLIAISALTSHRSGEVPVITADTRPIRVKPVDPGGLKVNAAENDVFSGGSDTRNAKLGPMAENPDTKALRMAAAETAPAAETPAPALSVTPPASVVQSTAKALPTSVAPVAAPRPAPVPAAPPIPAASAATAHGATVQLAALTSEQAAHGEWQALVKRMPDLLANHQPSFSRTERDGRTFWRVRTAGFADVTQARGFCEKVRAKGAGCSVTEF
jgi:septal ring-binding cell division protein DamX